MCVPRRVVETGAVARVVEALLRHDQDMADTLTAERGEEALAGTRPGVVASA